jgi:hypothetical protein
MEVHSQLIQTSVAPAEASGATEAIPLTVQMMSCSRVRVGVQMDVCVCTHGGATGVDGGLVGIRFGACAAIGLGAGSRDLDATVSPTAKRRLQSSRREAQDYCLRAQTT